jgi:hypothetical protein
MRKKFGISVEKALAATVRVLPAFLATGQIPT